MTTFKAGDKAYHRLRGEWVTLKERTELSENYPLMDAETNEDYTVDGKMYYSDKYPVLLDNEPEEHKWKPKEGDLCWFWGTGLQSNPTRTNLIVSRFDEMSGHEYTAINGLNYANCAPFEGELPKGVDL